MSRVVLCQRDELQPGELRSFLIGKIAVVLARKDEESFFAVRSVCPHQGANLSLGYLTGTNLPSPVGEFHYGRDREILKCPWHAWEFDLRSGRSLHDPVGQRVKSYQVTVEGNDVVMDYSERGPNGLAPT